MKVPNNHKTLLVIFCFIFLFFSFVLIRTLFRSRAQVTNNIQIRVGFFPNITHAPAIIGMASGQIKTVLGDDITIKVTTFNAGPSEIEALFAGEIDIGYIGPSPAINGYIKSGGKALKIISGVSSGGSSLVIQPELFSKYQLEGINALKGKKIASPQQGNTQDISLRHFAKQNNILDKITIAPIANADQMTMFKLKQIDGAWSPEPWASTLVVDAGGKRLFDERDLWEDKEFSTTTIIVSSKFLEAQPDIIKRWLEAHTQVIAWINAHPNEAQALLNSELEKLTSKQLSNEVLTEAWKMLNFNSNPLKSSILVFSDWAFEQGFLGEKKPDLQGIFYFKTLNEVANTTY